MPACFQLIDKATNEAVSLNDIDRKVCELLGKEFNDKKWCYLGTERVEGVDWYNTIGLSLAFGKDFKETRELFSESKEIGQIIDMLERDYKVSSFYQAR